MLAQHVLDDRQTQSRAPRPPRATRIDAIETLGEAGNRGGRNANAGVFHIEARAAIVIAPAHGDGPAFRRILRRVADQIGECGVEITAHAAQQDRVGKPQFEAVGISAATLADLIHHAADHRGDIDDLLRLGRVGLQPGQLQQIAYQLPHAFGLLAHLHDRFHQPFR